LATQSRAGSATFGEADSRASSSALSAASAADGGRPRSGEGCGEAGSGAVQEEEERMSRAALAVATSAECFRHAAFLMIRSSAGPTTRPDGDVPPSGAVGDAMERILGAGGYAVVVAVVT
jgi:hypothetical protein